MATTEKQPAKSEKKESKKKEEEEEQLPCPIRYFTCITRIAAAIVIIALWVCVVVVVRNTRDYFWNYHYWKLYLIMAAVVVTIMEIILMPLACLCKFVLCRFICEPLAEGWVNSIMYAFLAIPLFGMGYNAIISISAGLLIAALAAVYSIKVLADFSKCCPVCCPCLMVGGSKKSSSDVEAPPPATPLSPLKQSADGAGSYESHGSSTQP